MITYRKLHNLKIEKQYIEPIVEEEKTFEIRYNDRNYQVGDVIKFVPTTDSYYGDIIKYKFYVITYIFNNFGLNENYIVFSFKELIDKKLTDTLYYVNAHFNSYLSRNKIATKIVPIPDSIIASIYLDNKTNSYQISKYLMDNDKELEYIVTKLNKE